MVANMPPLRDFFSNPELGPTPKRRYFAEVTVFDSGPGVSTRRMLSRQQGQQPPGLGVEHSALLDCLKKHISTAAAETKGKGLHRVLQDLTSLGAFLWLRCGRLSLYRDFLAMPYKPEHASDEPFLLDWTGGIGGLTEVPSVEGSFFTALIPMADDFGQATLWPRK